MKRILILLFLATFITINLTSNLTSITPEQKKIILIDPGHGGFDGGAVSKRKTIEKFLNLKIALKLKDRLKDKYDVVMTREDDISLHNKDKDGIKSKKQQDLANRRKMIDDSNCDLFVSIHLNKFDSPNVKGCQVYYADNEKSKIFASILNENFGAITGGKRRVPKPNQAYIILKNIETTPSVIFEGGFLTNAEEDAMLNTDEYQSKLAEVIEKSIDDYFIKIKSMENDTSNTTNENNTSNTTIMSN
ncbi:MAG: N-acetylmuramoyl-L-alanine amidase [Oscillospiraceae bacterium]|nr:N-acetylmuramoyl-L-alanine amidase [Oscillospiraceae bacterium]